MAVTGLSAMVFAFYDEPDSWNAEQGREQDSDAVYEGATTASWFHDEQTATGEPMRAGLFASPSWPLGTEVRVCNDDGECVDGFIGDRGPGVPSSEGVMLDLDPETMETLEGVEAGRIPVTYEVLEWGSGPGEPGEPRPYEV